MAERSIISQLVCCKKFYLSATGEKMVLTITSSFRNMTPLIEAYC